jgi:protein-disulfide isomerase
MPESKSKDQTTTTNLEALEKRLKALEQSVKDVKKISTASFKGRYDEDIEAEMIDHLKYGVIPSNGGFLKQNFHLVFLLFSFAILVFSFLTFAAVTGKGLNALKKFGIKIEPVSVAGTVNTPAVPATPQAPVVRDVEVSVNDDPVLGDANAPFTIVEFSDYDCPFCKLFHQTTYKDLKKEYIDTGKVKFVYRDLPLAQIHPLATEKALAANCSREQGGDAAYYKFHDEIFIRGEQLKATLTKDDLKKIAADFKLNTNQFNQCLDSEKYLAEVQSDMKAANELEIFGTPTFIIGKSTPSGVFTGRIIEGTAPISEFEEIMGMNAE